MFHFGAPHTPLFFRSFRCSGQRDHRLLGASLRLAMLPLRAVPRWVVQAAGTASRGLRAFSMFVPGPFGEICLLGLANFTQTNPLGAEVGVRSGFLRRDACFAEHWPPVRLCPKAGRLGAALLAHDGHRETRFESNEGTLESRSTILSQEDRSARTLCAPVGGPVSGPVGRPVGGPVSGPVGARRKKERKEGMDGTRSPPLSFCVHSTRPWTSSDHWMSTLAIVTRRWTRAQEDIYRHSIGTFGANLTAPKSCGGYSYSNTSGTTFVSGK
jgi:hypothetical protein